jgi:hypothetical protein
LPAGDFPALAFMSFNDRDVREERLTRLTLVPGDSIEEFILIRPVQ